MGKTIAPGVTVSMRLVIDIEHDCNRQRQVRKNSCSPIFPSIDELERIYRMQSIGHCPNGPPNRRKARAEDRHIWLLHNKVGCKSLSLRFYHIWGAVKSRIVRGSTMQWGGTMWYRSRSCPRVRAQCYFGAGSTSVHRLPSAQLGSDSLFGIWHLSAPTEFLSLYQNATFGSGKGKFKPTKATKTVSKE